MKVSLARCAFCLDSIAWNLFRLVVPSHAIGWVGYFFFDVLALPEAIAITVPVRVYVVEGNKFHFIYFTSESGRLTHLDLPNWPQSGLVRIPPPQHLSPLSPFEMVNFCR